MNGELVCHVCFDGDVYDQLKDYLNNADGNWTQEDIANIIGLYDTNEAEPLIPDDVTRLTDEQKQQYGEAVCAYNREITKKQKAKLADAINHPARSFAKIYSIDGWNAAKRNNRINMIALKFAEVVTRRKDALAKKGIDVTREEICNGHVIDGKKVDGQFSIFQELFEFFYSEYKDAWDWYNELKDRQDSGETLDAEDEADMAEAKHQMEEYAKVINNWSALCAFARMRIRDREGIKLGHNLDYAAASDEDDFNYESVEETYTLEESVREGWMQHHNETSAFSSLGKEVRKFLATVPKLDDDGERIDDDLGYPVFYDPISTHQYLAERLRGVTTETDMCNILQASFDSEYDAHVMQDVCRHLIITADVPKQAYTYDDDGNIMYDTDGQPLMRRAFPKDGFTNDFHPGNPTIITQLLVDMHKNFVGYTAMLEGDNGYYIKDLNRQHDNPDHGVYLDSVTLGTSVSENSIFDENGHIDYVKYAKWQEEVSRMLPPVKKQSGAADSGNVFSGLAVYDADDSTGYWNKSLTQGDRLEFLYRALTGLGVNIEKDDIMKIIGDSYKRATLLNNIREIGKFMHEGMGNFNGGNQEALGQLLKLASELNTLRHVESLITPASEQYEDIQRQINEASEKQKEAARSLRDVNMRNAISWTYADKPNPPVQERIFKILDLRRGAVDAMRVERRVSAYDRKGKSNSRYSDVTPSYMGDFIDKIHGYIKAGNGQGLRAFLMEKYGKDAFFYNEDTGKFYNKWLQELYDSSMEMDKNGNISERCFAALFGYTNFLYGKIDDRPVIFENFSSRAHAISMIKAFVQKRDVKKNPKYEYCDYPCFILGDAGVQMYFTAKRYEQNDIVSGLMDVYDQELVRMKQVAELRKSLADKGVDEKKMPEGYVSAEHVFTTLMFLNPDFEGGKYWRIATGNEHNSSISKESLENNENRIDNVNILIDKIENDRNLLKAAINAYMEDTLTKFKDRLCEYQILQKAADGSYMEVAERGKITTLFGPNAHTLYEGNVEALIDDFFWNTKFATIQQIQMFTVDTAFYDPYMTVKDLQKRYKEIYAPGKGVSTQARDRDGKLYSQSGKETVVYIDDISESCEWNPEFDEALRTVFKDHPEIYEKYKEGSSLTDGQAWRSLDSYREVMGMSGEWTNAMQDAYERIKDIQNDIKNRPSGSITKEETAELTELMVMMQPRKPYLFTLEQVDLGNGKVCSIPVQHKYAEIVVIPELLPKGKLKDMVEWMQEEHVDMVASTKCVKVGGFGSCDISEVTDRESMWNALKTGYKHEFNYSDYRIQNGVPQHLDQAQLFGTQIRKLIFSGIKQSKDYSKYLNNILRNHKGGTLTINIPGAPNDGQVTLHGKELIALYNVLIMANMFDSYEQMERYASTKQQISNMVTQNSIANATQVDDVITGFSIIEDGVPGAGDFMMPIGEPMSEHDTTALLLSCLQKGVNKQRILGGSCVQASAFGVTPDNPAKPYVEETSSLREVCSKNDDGVYDNVLYEEVEVTFARSYIDPTGKEIPLEFNDWCFADNEGHHNIGDLLPSDVEVKEGDSEWEEYQSYTYKLIDGKWEPCAYSEYHADDPNTKVFKPLIEVSFPGILDMIAYRIPTERLYSAINCKIKRFSHPKLGGVIRVPVSGTTKAGFDFDIDKLYFFMKEFSQEHFTKKAVSDIWTDIYGIDKEGNLTGNTEFPGLYDALKKAQEEARKRFERRGSLLSSNVKITGSSEAVEELKKVAEGSVEYDKEKPVVDYWKDAVIDGKPLEEVYGSSAEVFRKYVENHKELHAKYHAFDEYDPSVSPFNSEKDDEGNIIRKGNSRTARNNMIIGIIRERLKDQETMKERYTPGGFPKLSDAALEMRIIQFSDPKDITTDGNIDYRKVKEIAKKVKDRKNPVKDPEPNYDYSDPSTILIYNQQNQIAAKLIGIFANQNTHHVLCSTLQELRLKEAIAFGNHTDGLADFLHKNDEDFKAEVDVNVAELLAAAVDAVKDPVLNYLNLNIVTADSAAVLFRLGYSQREVGLLFNQPIIKEICEYVANNNCSTKTAINEVARKYETDGKSWKKMDYNANRTTTDILGNNILEGKKAPKDRDSSYNENQLQVLKLFNQIQGVASEMNSFVQATRFTASNSIGSTWGDVIAVMQRTEKFANLVADKNDDETNESSADTKNKVYGKDDGPKLIIVPKEREDGKPNEVISMAKDLLDLSPEEYAARQYGNPLAFEQCMMDIVRRAMRLFGKYYPYFSKLYETVRNRLSALTEYGTLDGDTFNSIHRDLAVYLLGLQKGSDFAGETPIRRDVNLEEDQKTLAERLSISTESRKNRDFFVKEFPDLIEDLIVNDTGKKGERLRDRYPFFNRLEIGKSRDGKKKWVQTMGVGGMQAMTANEFVESWTDAFQSDEQVTVDGKQLRVSDLALGLFYHNFYRLGFSFNPTSTIHLTPTVLKVMITLPSGASYADFMNNLIAGGLELSEEDIDAFVRQYILNHLDNYKFVFRPKAGTEAAKFIEEKIRTSSDEDMFTLTYNEMKSKNLVNLLTTKVTKSTVHYKPIIAIRNEVGKIEYYMAQTNNGKQFNVASLTDSRVKYIKVDPQGAKGRSLDYRTKENFESYQELDQVSFLQALKRLFHISRGELNQIIKHMKGMGIRVHTLGDMEIFMQQHPELFGENGTLQQLVENYDVFNNVNSDKIEIEDTKEPQKYRRSQSNPVRKFYLKDQRDKGCFVLVKDTEHNNYFVYFKDTKYPYADPLTYSDSFTDKEKDVLFQAIADSIPEGATISAQYETSESHIDYLNRLSNLGFAQFDTKLVYVKDKGYISAPVSTKNIQQTAISNIQQEMDEIKARAIADGTFMKAPNGKKSNLNEKQWLQVRTRAFKEWFGDWEKFAKLKNATVIWGHPASGKTHLFKQGRKDIIDFDSEYKVRINKIMGLPDGADAKELRKAARKERKQEYHDLIMKLFDEAVAEAKRTGKKLLVSDMMLLREREADIDVITNMSDSKFVERSAMRGETDATDKMLWKNDINEAMANVSDKSKVINTEKFISDDLDGTNVSKVIDENGEPLVVYHGTNDKFSEFHKGNSKWYGETGIFFSSDKDYAESMSIYKALHKPIWKTSGDDHFYNIPVFLNIKNPAQIDNISNSTVGKYREKLERYSSIDGVVGHDAYFKDDDLPKSKGVEYVAFNPNQIKSATDNIGTFLGVTNRVDLLKTADGEVYGFVYQGEIYIDETKLDPQVPIHEYTHIWDEAVMQSNPRLWERGKRLLRDSKNRVLRDLWNEITESDAYGKKWQTQGKTEQEIENLIAGEVHARLVGERGAELLEQIEKAEGGKGLIARLKRWMKDVFKYLAKTFGTWTDEALNKLTLEDFINMPLRDFLDGINPNDYKYPSISSEISAEMEQIKQDAIANGTFMKAPNGKPTNLDERQWLQVRTKNFLDWFGDWINNPEEASKVVDENGEPLVVYRASRWAGLKNPPAFASKGDYTIFDKSRNSSGFFFTNKKSAEERYTGRNLRAFFLNSRNPDTSNNFNILQADREVSIGMGYDSVLFTPDKEGVNGDNFEVKVFEPNQIKSATDNNGEFSSANDDINMFVIGEKGAAAFDAAEEASVRMDNLAVAVDMENSGKDALTIKQATGWERGADGKWRYEEMDLQINKKWFDKVKSMELSERRELSFKLKDIVDSNEISRLIQQYPLIASLTITVANGNFFDILQSTRGSYNPETNTLMLNFARVFLGDDVTIESIRSTLMHEIQHLIQTEEGFAEGGNTRVVEDRPEMKKLMQLSDTLKSKEDQLFAEENQDNIKLINQVETLGEYTEEYKRWEDEQNRRSEINEERRKHNRKVNEKRGELIQRQAQEYNELANVKFSAFDKMFHKSKIKEHEAALKKLDQMHERQLEEFDKVNPKQPLLREEYFFDGPTYNFSRYSFEERNAMRDQVRELKLQWRRNSEKYKMLQEEISEIQNEIDKTRYNLYSRIAGEVESRAVERRLNLSPEERRNTLFTDEMYQDVAQKDLIFMNESLNAESVQDIDMSDSDVENDYIGKEQSEFDVDNITYVDENADSQTLRTMYSDEEWSYMYNELLKRSPAFAMMAEDGDFTQEDLIQMFTAPERSNAIIIEEIRRGVEDGSIIPMTIDENKDDIPVCM